jgi:cell pole-organizing protein PopZ
VDPPSARLASADLLRLTLISDSAEDPTVAHRGTRVHAQPFMAHVFLERSRGMSAANLVQTAGDALDEGSREASNEAREPSMEEILTSIRRLIAQDQALFAADLPASVGAEAPQAPDASDQGAVPIHGLRQAIEAEFRAPSADAVRDGGEAPEQPETLSRENARGESLVSPETEASVAAAFNALVASRLARDQDAMLAMTRDALRPLLTAWLDAHLPALVERLVSAEIARMAKGA